MTIQELAALIDGTVQTKTVDTSPRSHLRLLPATC